MNASLHLFHPQENGSPTTPIFRPARASRSTNNRIITLQDAEYGIQLRVNETFILDLGDACWNVRVRDESILASADGFQFQALAAGKTCVVVTGDAPYENPGSRTSRRKIFMEFPVTVLP